MIPVCLVTGFLGSGKTTLLKHLAARYRDRRVVYLVNDFAPIDVDGPLMEEMGQAAVAIAGGSIFCKCLVTEFIKQLNDIRRGHYSDGTPPDGLVIEASGMADPRVIEQMLIETGLDSAYTLTTILTVLDPGRFLKLIHTLPNIKAQVEAADTVLINKVDLYDPDVLKETHERLQTLLRPGSVVLSTRQAAVSLDVFAPRDARRLTGAYAACADPNYACFSLTHSAESLDILLAALHQLEPMVYRIKGCLLIAGRWWYIEYEGRSVSARPFAEGPDTPGLAIIAKAHWAREVEQRLARLQGEAAAVNRELRHG